MLFLNTPQWDVKGPPQKGNLSTFDGWCNLSTFLSSASRIGKKKKYYDRGPSRSNTSVWNPFQKLKFRSTSANPHKDLRRNATLSQSFGEEEETLNFGVGHLFWKYSNIPSPSIFTHTKTHPNPEVLLPEIEQTLCRSTPPILSTDQLQPRWKDCCGIGFSKCCLVQTLRLVNLIQS